MTANGRKYRLLFLESGGGYGGSSALLYSTLRRLDGRRFEPYVAYYQYNDGPNTRLIRNLNVDVLFLDQLPEVRAELASRREDSRPHSPRPAKKSATDNHQPTGKTSLLGALKRRVRTTMGEDLYEDLSTAVKGSPRGLRRLHRLCRLINRMRIDAVMLNNDVPFHTVGILGAKLASVPCICRKAWFGAASPIERLMARYVDCFIASSKAMAQHHRAMRLAARKLVTVYEGVEVETSTRLMDRLRVREELRVGPQAPLIGSMSRIAEGKGHPDLVSAAALLSQRCRDARFLIVGDDVSGGGRRLDRLKEQADESGIGDKVIFAGWREDTANLLSAIDIFVHPNSTYLEALSIAVLEAMAAGKPTVVTATGALPETTADGVTGFVVPPSNPQRLAEALLKLIQSPELRQTMGRNARMRAEKLFDIRKTVRESEKVFLEVLHARAARRAAL